MAVCPLHSGMMFLTSCKACLLVYNSTMRTHRFRLNSSLNWFQLVPETNKKKVYIQLPTKECHVINFNINREVKKRLIFSAAGFITCLLTDWHHTWKISWPNRLKILSIILFCNIFATQFSCESLKNNLYKPI